MYDKQLAELERQLDALLGEVSTTAEKVRTVPVEEGIAILKQLDVELRPFIIKYTALINRTKQYVPIESSKLAKFIPLIEKLGDCVERGLANEAMIYDIAIDLILNGANCKIADIYDSEDLVRILFELIKATEDTSGTIRLYTPRIEGSGLLGINVTKDDNAEG